MVRCPPVAVDQLSQRALTYNDLRAAGRVESAGQGLSHRSIQPLFGRTFARRRGHGQLEVRHVCSS
jgi:hypothetical protein